MVDGTCYSKVGLRAAVCLGLVLYKNLAEEGEGGISWEDAARSSDSSLLVGRSCNL